MPFLFTLSTEVLEDFHFTEPAVIPSATTIVAAEEATVAQSFGAFWSGHTVKKAKVTVKVGKAKFKAAKVSGKKFTFATSELKKGTTVKVKVTKSGYKTVTKTVKVK